MRRLSTFVLALGLAAVVLSTTVARAEELDTLGPERQQCKDLRWEGKYLESYECLRTLWKERRDELSRTGKTDVLWQMAEYHVIAKSPADAQACYEAILSVDPHWLPADFDNLSSDYRDPILAAYKSRGFLMRSPGLHNVALLDFEVVDLSQEGADLSKVAVALPTYISSYLNEVLQKAKLKGDETPLKIVSHRERAMLMAELAQSQGMAEAAVVTAGTLDASALSQAGELQAVQGFLSGTIIRGVDGKVQIALRLISVETGEIGCAQTARGKAEDVFPLLQKALRKWVECAVEGADLSEEDGAAELGPMAQGVLALEQFHQAIELAEARRFGEALELAEAALELRPEADDLQRLVQNIQAQQASADLVMRTDLTLPQADLQ